MEAGREVVAVKVVALGGRHRAQVGAGQTADTAAARLDGLAERPELLGVVAVRAEGRVRRGEALGERTGRRGRVGVGGVVDRSYPVLVSSESREGAGAHKSRNVQGTDRFPRNRIEGVRSACCAAWRRTLEANMLT